MTYAVAGFAVLCLLSVLAGFAVRARVARTSATRSRRVHGGAGRTDLQPAALHRWRTLGRVLVGPDLLIATTAVWLMLLDTALALAAPWPVKIVIDQVIGHQPYPRVLSPLAHLGPIAATIGVAAAGLALLAGGALAAYLVTYLVTAVEERATGRLRVATMAHVLHVPASGLADYPTGELANRVSGDAALVSGALTSAVETLIPETSVLLGMAAITALLDWRLTLVALAVIPMFIGTARLRNRSVRPAQRVARARSGDLAALTTDLLSRLPAVQVFAQAPAELTAFRRASDRTARAEVEAVDAGARFTPITDVLPGIALAGALIAGALEVRSGHLTVGGLVVFLAYLSSLTTPVHALASLSGSLTRGLASRERLAELLQIPATPVRVGAEAGSDDAQVSPVAISVDAVTVRRGPRRPVLAELTFAIDEGEFVCIAGPSGAGKTTVLSVLSRLVVPDAGRVRLRGRDLATIPPEQLYKIVTLVPQDPWLHTGSIADNIRYGRPARDRRTAARRRRPGGRGAVRRVAAGRVRHADRRTRQPHHSGGQQRRIALARALFSTRPSCCSTNRRPDSTGKPAPNSSPHFAR